MITLSSNKLFNFIEIGMDYGESMRKCFLLAFQFLEEYTELWILAIWIPFTNLERKYGPNVPQID